MFKFIFRLFILLIVIAAAGAGFLYMYPGYAVKFAIMYFGSRATAAMVNVEDVQLSIAAGEGSIKGLSIGNPKGFDASPTVSLGQISMKIDTASVRGDGPIIIHELDIADPRVTYEVNANGGSNLQAIQKNVASFASSVSGSSKGPSANGSSRKVIIDDLYIHSGRMGVSSTMLQGKTLTAALPAIHLRDIGKNTGGATPAEVAQQIVGSITSSATNVAGVDFGSVLGSVKDVVPGNVGAIGDKLKGLF